MSSSTATSDLKAEMAQSSNEACDGQPQQPEPLGSLKPRTEETTAVAKKHKSVPENWKALPEGKFRQVVNHIEAVLFEISTDGTSVNVLEDHVSVPTLTRWADHLRSALKALTVGN